MIVPTNRIPVVLACSAEGTFLAKVDSSAGYDWKKCNPGPGIDTFPVSKQTDKPLMLLCDMYDQGPGHCSLIILDDVTREYSLTHYQRLSNITFAPVTHTHRDESHTIVIDTIYITTVSNHPLHDSEWMHITDYMFFKVPKSDLTVGGAVSISNMSFKLDTANRCDPNEKVILSVSKTNFPEIYKTQDNSILFIPDIECALYVMQQFGSNTTIELWCIFDETRQRWIPDYKTLV